MGDSATIEIRGDNKNLKQTLGNSEKTIGKFGSSIKKVFLAIGAAVAVKKLFDFGKKLFTLFNEQEQAEARVGAVLRATGEAAGFNLEQMKKLASQLQANSKFGDEVVLSAQAIIATFKNIRGEEFKDATIAAADMATVMQTDLKSAAQLVAKALQDPVKGLTALTRSGVTFTDSQKDMIKQLVATGDVVGAQRVILGELEGQFKGAAAAAADTFGGRMTQLKNRLGDVGENIFKALIPALDMLTPLLDRGAALIESWIPIIASTVKWIIDMGKAVVETFAKPAQAALENMVKRFTFFQTVVETLWAVVQTAFGGMGGSVGDFAETAVEWLVKIQDVLLDLAINGFIAVQVIIENWRDAVSAAGIATALALVKAFENVKHLFTEVLPSVLTWFADNWQNVLTDVANFTATVFGNMFNNITGFFGNVMSWLTGSKGDWEWKGLTDGFETSLKKLPEIAKRQKSELEKALEADLAATTGRIGASFDEKRKAFDDKFRANLDKLKGLGLEGDAEVEEITANQDALDAAFAVTGGAPKKKAAKKAGAGSGTDATGTFEGLTALNKRITQARFKGKSDEEKVADAVKEEGQKQVDAQIKIAGAVDGLGSRLDLIAQATEDTADQIQSIGALA